MWWEWLISIFSTLATVILTFSMYKFVIIPKKTKKRKKEKKMMKKKIDKLFEEYNTKFSELIDSIIIFLEDILEDKIDKNGIKIKLENFKLYKKALEGIGN